MYNSNKTTQTIAYLLKISEQGFLTLRRVHALLYNIDRYMIEKHGYSLTDDSYTSSSRGVVLENTQQLVEDYKSSGSGIWKVSLDAKDSYLLSLDPALGKPNLDELSQVDIEVIEQVSLKYKDVETADLIVKMLAEYTELKIAPLDLPFTDEQVADGLDLEPVARRQLIKSMQENKAFEKALRG